MNRTVAVAINAMEAQYNTNPADLLACVGPSICHRHYEVGGEVIDKVRRAYGDDAETILYQTNGNKKAQKAKLDLWTANQITLENVGVRYIELSQICTACHLEDWYSHRGENGQTGRFGVLIGL